MISTPACLFLAPVQPSAPDSAKFACQVLAPVRLTAFLTTSLLINQLLAMASVVYSSAIDSIASLGGMALSPFLSGPLLLSVTYYPDIVRDIITSVAKNLPEQAVAWLSSLPAAP